jgi:DnaJ-class molecular chaperone
MKKIACNACDGVGLIKNITCPQCDGTGIEKSTPKPKFKSKLKRDE